MAYALKILTEEEEIPIEKYNTTAVNFARELMKRGLPK